tara:strand:+ start:171 stop:371 length:201 start_codon:yes stop_codon:yes gene_type:complete
MATIHFEKIIGKYTPFVVDGDICAMETTTGQVFRYESVPLEDETKEHHSKWKLECGMVRQPQIVED